MINTLDSSIITIASDVSYDLKNISERYYNFQNKKFKKILQDSMPLKPPKLERSGNINFEELPKIIIMQNEIYSLKLINLKSIDTLHGEKNFFYEKELEALLTNINKLKAKCEEINFLLKEIRQRGIKMKNNNKIFLDNRCINVIPKYLDCFNDYETKSKIYNEMYKILKLHNNFVPIYKVLLTKTQNNITVWEDTYMLMTLFGEIYYLNYKSDHNPVKYTKYTEQVLINFF